MPSEFTPEMDQKYLESLLAPIEQSRQVRRGAFRRDVLERGLAGDPYESSGVAGIETGVDRLKSDVASQFAFQRAGLQREERLTKEGRDFASGEAQKARDFQGYQADLDRAVRREDIASRRQSEDDSFLLNLLGIGGQVAGAYFGRRV